MLECKLQTWALFHRWIQKHFEFPPPSLACYKMHHPWVRCTTHGQSFWKDYCNSKQSKPRRNKSPLRGWKVERLRGWEVERLRGWKLSITVATDRAVTVQPMGWLPLLLAPPLGGWWTPWLLFDNTMISISNTLLIIFTGNKKPWTQEIWDA